jgi:hypothetical protein
MLDRITPVPGPCEPLRHAGADEHLEISLRFSDFRRGVLHRWDNTAMTDDLAGDLAEHALHALAASLLADDRTVLVDTDRWLVDLFTARGHDPLLAPRLWRAVRETVGELLPQARADLGVVVPAPAG